MDKMTRYATLIYDHELTPKFVGITITTLVLLLIICWAFKLVSFEKLAIRKARGMQEGLVGGVGEPAHHSSAPLLFVDPHSAGRPLLPVGLTKLAENPTLPDVVENVAYDSRWVPSRAGWAYGPLTGEGSLYKGF
jgi:hypothetical protein